MPNCVLKSLSARNFASFADKISFYTTIDQGKKELVDDVFTIGSDAFSKVSILYGANGSGKTFFCKILREMQRIMVFSTLLDDNRKFFSPSIMKSLDRAVPNFAFDEQYKGRPTLFAIDIVIEETNYHYEFEIMGKKIVSERLTKKYRRTEVLLERKSSANKDIYLRSDLKSFESNKGVVREEALCLSMAAALNNSLARTVFEGIQSILILNMAASHSVPLDDETAFSEERLRKYVQILSKADPTIRKLNVEISEEELGHSDLDTDDFEGREKIKRRTVSVQSDHAMYSDNEEIGQTSIDFFEEESLGTVKLFTSMPYLFDVLENGGVIIIDELENGLHLSLAREIIGLFNNAKTNPHNAQLICTSHQPLLVEYGFRRDQVWVASKDDFGKCQISRMSDLKTSRAKFNLSNKLLEGAFGCNPGLFFGDLEALYN
ncbi:MAG: ATP-binding protein [Clostridiales bacterium]|nr:ATP-binding protein [Clostridiales bacterium]